MIKKLLGSGGIISTVLLAGLMAGLAVTRHQVIALLAVAAVEFVVWWRRPDSTLQLAADTYASWLISGTTVVMVALSPRFVTQIVFILAFMVIRLAVHLGLAERRPGSLALFMQFASLTAIFSAAQVWRWSAVIVMILAWGASWLVAYHFLQTADGPQRSLLASVWSLVVAELAWIMSWWMIAYLSPGAYIIVPQAALLITGLAYVLGGIYRLHRQGQLSRNRLTEYLFVAIVLLIIIVLGTHWNGAS